jgi:hypothetical protein
MSIFDLYFNLGVEHITDLKGYDHIVFLIALCATYSLNQWKNVLVLITAFTLGHTATLALATLNLVKVSSSLIEFLIPLTIFITAVFNVYGQYRGLKDRKYGLNYTLALVFGFIHGLGFSNYLKELLGASSSLIKPLFAFNLGVEAGQLMIVAIIFLVSFLLLTLARLRFKTWNLTLSSVAASIALFLMVQRVGALI